MRHRVIVTLHRGESFAGVLWAADDRVWVLRQAEALGIGEEQANVEVDGELLVLTEDIAYVQVL